MRTRAYAAIFVLLLTVWATPVRAAESLDRDYVSITGLPQVLKYVAAAMTAVAEKTRQKYPLLQNITTASGVALFCAGLGANKPDLFILPTDTYGPNFDACKSNGIQNVARLIVGRDAFAIVINRGEKPFNVSRRTLYLALAARVPSLDDSVFAGNPLSATFVPNRFKRWSDIDPNLPNAIISLLAPPAQSVDWWAINDMIMQQGCRSVSSVAAVAAVDPKLFGQLCVSRRTDGVIVYADDQQYADQPDLTPRQPDQVAVTPYYLTKLEKNILMLSIDDVFPSDLAINNGSYGLARLVSLYVKTEKFKIVPGLRQFVVEMVSARAVGPDGYMTKIGLVPPPELETRENSVAARFGLQ